MTRGESPGGAATNPADLIRQLTAAISNTGSRDLSALLQQLTAGAVPAALDPFAAPPSRRGPRRADVVTYRVRVDLKGTKPPLWRRLELSSDLYLDQLHDILQAAFGWTDSHLHQFGSGPEYYSRETEYYLCPYQVDEGEAGVPEEDVRLDEVLANPGDKLFYLYDFGDDWEHVLKLEAVLPRDEAGTPARTAACVAGRRDGPPEDCGGVGCYELISAATDPTNPDHSDAVAEFARMYGDEVSPERFDMTPFDLDTISDRLALLTWLAPAGTRPEPAELPVPLEELIGAVRDGPTRRELRQLAGMALAGEPVQIDAETAARMVHPYAWLLDRVGADGIRLTGAGYLPPAHVQAAGTELGLLEDWVGKGNREVQTLPVLHLRESAAKMGLLRKQRGTLLTTARGRKLQADPLAMWWHLAEQMPVKSGERCETQAGLIWLAAVAAQAPGPEQVTARMLNAIGWMNSDGTPLTVSDAAIAAHDTRNVLRRLSGITDDPRGYGPGTPNAMGVAFARAAMASWPDTP